MMKPVPPCCSLCSSSSPWSRRRCCGPKKNSNGSPLPPPPKGLEKRREDPLTISVEVIETTEDIVSSAISAKDGINIEPVRAVRAGASRCASERGVTLTELATTMPKMTAAAIRTEKEMALLVDFSMASLLLLYRLQVFRVPVRGFKIKKNGPAAPQAAGLPDKHLTLRPSFEIPRRQRAAR